MTGKPQTFLREHPERRRPTSSLPRNLQIFLLATLHLLKDGQNRTTATSSHLVPTSSQLRGRPQKRPRPSSPSPLGDEVASGVRRHPTHQPHLVPTPGTTSTRKDNRP